MTTSRAIRGTRAKIFLYICALLVVTGLIACYNNTLSQLDDVRKSNDICRQQEENLSTQLQVISDYKQRLEKSLKTEKAEHQQTKINLETKLNEEKSKSDKSFGDAKLKFDSLQQHFNLLQTEYDDFKEECSRHQQKQQEEINDLQSKLEELNEELKKVKTSKESLKTEYMEILSRKDECEKQFKDSLKGDNDNESRINHLIKENHQLQRELDEAKRLSGTQNKLNEANIYLDISSPSSVNSKQSSFSPLKSPDHKLAVNPEQSVLAKPNDNDKMPPSKSTTKAGVKSSTGSLNGARPLLVPTVTPETVQKKNISDKKIEQQNKVPEGVVPVPKKSEDQNEQPELLSNNRYRNVNEGKQPADMDKENGAHEQFDVPHQPNGFDGLQFGVDEQNKKVGKQNIEKKHIDDLAVNDKDRKNYDQEQGDYKDLQNDVQLENEEDDDADDYDDRLARQKDPAVRH